VTARYPDEEYAKTICKIGQGAETCRYLAMYPAGYSCEKHTAMGRDMDEWASTGRIGAQGDNCDGLDSRE
jgi:hypothetical protein